MPVSLRGLAAGTVLLRRPLDLRDQRADRFRDLRVVFLENAAERERDPSEVLGGLLENLVAPTGPFIDVGKLLGRVEILVARLCVPPAQLQGTAAELPAPRRRQALARRRLWRTIDSLEHVQGLVHERHGARGRVVVL